MARMLLRMASEHSTKRLSSNAARFIDPGRGDHPLTGSEADGFSFVSSGPRGGLRYINVPSLGTTKYENPGSIDIGRGNAVIVGDTATATAQDPVDTTVIQFRAD